MKLHQNKIYLISNYEKLRKNYSTKKIKKPVENKNNVFPLKPEFRQYVNETITEDNPRATIKSIFISVIFIFFWCFSMCLLTKASYQFLQEICLNSIQEFNLEQK